MGTIKEILKNRKVQILIILLIISLIAIWPFSKEGVSIRSVEKDSPAFNIINVEKGRPMSFERVIGLDNEEIHSLDDYYTYLKSIGANSTVRVYTNKDSYKLTTDESGELGLEVVESPSSNIRKGLDLEGGARVFLSPIEEVEDSIVDDAVISLKERLNAFGLSNVVVRKINTPTVYIVVELAGTTPAEVKDLLLTQGKFEAKIGNETVIRGSDVKSVGPGGIDQNSRGCGPSGSGVSCPYRFPLTISRDAAEKFAFVTDNLSIVDGSLSENITFYLDDIEVSSFPISPSLKGQVAQQVSVGVSGSGKSESEAREDGRSEMRRIQTILKSGSLPIQLEISQSETISPVLGEKFTRNALLVGILAIITVGIIVGLIYRKFKIVIPMLIVMTSEIVIILGVAALIQWQLDLAAIAGIIIAAGTGVDDQIIIISEIMRGEQTIHNWKEKMKKAFFIIMGSYLTTVVAVIPLAWAGAGLLKGFAFATIVGVSVGVFVTRPVFATMLEKLSK